MKNKLLILLLTTFSLGVTSLLAQTTMCYKENHASMSTIESTKLYGGECKGEKTVKQMKNEGWEIDDIEISSAKKGKNYIYIFKKDVNNSTIYGNEEEITATILAKLEAKKQKEIKEQKALEIKQSRERGQSLYTKKCERCHGSLGEIEAYNTSLAINTLSYNDFRRAIRDYNNGADKGMGVLMQPYAAMLNTSKVKDIYSYLKEINGKTKK